MSIIEDIWLKSLNECRNLVIGICGILATTNDQATRDKLSKFIVEGKFILILNASLYQSAYNACTLGIEQNRLKIAIESLLLMNVKIPDSLKNRPGNVYSKATVCALNLVVLVAYAKTNNIDSLMN